MSRWARVDATVVLYRRLLQADSVLKRLALTYRIMHRLDSFTEAETTRYYRAIRLILAAHRWTKREDKEE